MVELIDFFAGLVIPDPAHHASSSFNDPATAGVKPSVSAAPILPQHLFPPKHSHVTKYAGSPSDAENIHAKQSVMKGTVRRAKQQRESNVIAGRREMMFLADMARRSIVRLLPRMETKRCGKAGSRVRTYAIGEELSLANLSRSGAKQLIFRLFACGVHKCEKVGLHLFHISRHLNYFTIISGI